MTSEESNVHEMATTLRSELAALQYKRDRLLSELQETKGLLRTRDQRALELQVETEQLKEQAARQNAIIASLRSRIQYFFLSILISTWLSTFQMFQENSRLRNKTCSLSDNLTSVEIELRSCRELLDRALSEKEHLQRQCTSHQMEIDKLKQSDFENVNLYQHCLITLYKCIVSTIFFLVCLSVSNVGDHCGYDDFIGCYPEQLCRSSQTTSFHNRKRKTHFNLSYFLQQVETYREKIAILNQQINRQNETQEEINARIRHLEEDKCHIESRLHKTEAELSACELTKENLKRDKSIFVAFLDRLAKSLNMEEISKEVGLDLQSESLLCRAEQLSRLESDKLIDKISFSRLKKVLKQVDRLNLQLSEARSLSRDLKCQLTEAEEYKNTAIDRAHKIDELEKRLMESEMLRTRYCNKVSLLKDQMRSSSDTAHQERTMHEHSTQVLREDLSKAKANYLLDFRRSIVKILGLDMSCPDYEIISKLSTLVNAHHDFTLVSKRYDEPLKSPCHHVHHRTPTPRYTTDDSGFMDPLDDLDSDINNIYNKRPHRGLS
ncbi:uncharacterized protein LOC103505839 [Diaphorina citri]|uniref:Uncharacterized protein LOC103505839 n=1 Tax=Diaphorina citri TaxID=121845 RepID=A0A3Q0IQG5_DIACI|nr:uncharacterized protein LOC103505839 [Diaphorina citri]